MTPKEIKRVSKWLSRHLRHRSPVITPDREGWALLSNVISASPGRVTLEAIEIAVAGNDKQRFTIDGDRIRANQGHSIDVDLKLERLEPPEFLYHGTYHKAVAAITAGGLLKMKRHHVHMSEDTGTAVTVGRRSGSPVLFKVKAREMSRVGYHFFRSANGVWLTERVPPEYLERQP